MNSETLRRIRTIFDRAVDLSPESRATLLDEACGSDGGLRAEVERLLAADSGAGTFLGRRLLAATCKEIPKQFCGTTAGALSPETRPRRRGFLHRAEVQTTPLSPNCRTKASSAPTGCS